MTVPDVPPELIALVHRLADASGAAIRPYFRVHGIAEDKSDATPVTAADRAGEHAIRDILAAERPHDGIWGEEMGRQNLDSEYLWIIDPIDGTKAFVTGKPMFATLIALLHRGVPVLGIIDQPVLRERWIGGAGHPTTFNGARAATRVCADLADAWFNATTPLMFAGKDDAPHRALTARVKHALYGGDAYAYGLLASGHIDLIMEAQMKLHDFAALVPVITAAGGAITGWNGEPLGMESSGYVLASGDPALHKKALDVIRSAWAG
ncbi:MAG: histidinol-phosphatase [Alphaproteobacteria bacterium]